MCNRGPARPYRNTPTAPRIGALTFAFAVRNLQVSVATLKVQWTINYSLVRYTITFHPFGFNTISPYTSTFSVLGGIKGVRNAL